VMDLEARPLKTFDHFQPFRPDRIDQNIDFVRLDQKGGMANPGDTDFACPNLRKLWGAVIARALDEERWNKDFGKKVAFVPIGPRTQLYPGGSFVLRAVLRWLANDVPSAFFRKRNRHCRGSI